MIESAISFIEHGDVFRILPACTTLAARVKETQECERVHVVGAPCSAHESFKVHLRFRIEKSLPFHVAQADGHTEILFPLSLHPLGERSVLCLRVEDKLNLVRGKRRTGETTVRVLNHRIASLAEYSARFSRIERFRFGLRISRKHSFRHESIQGLNDATPVCISDFIDRKVECLSYLRIV